MTRNQIKRKLEEEGVSTTGIIEIEHDEVEVLVRDVHGDIDFDETDRKADEVAKALGFGGFKCAGGWWVLRNGYSFSGKDYCDKSSPAHY